MKNIYVGLGLFILFIGLGFMVTHNIFNITYIDKIVGIFFNSIRTEVGIEFMKSITTFGEKPILTPIIIVSLLFFLLRKHWEFGIIFALGITLVGYLTVFSKEYFGVSRPSLFFGSASGFSYPSGHTSSAAIVFLILALYFTTIRYKPIKYTGLFVCLVSAASVGISRMYLNVHWFTDVIGGFLLALSCAVFLYGIVQILEKKKDI